MVRKTVRSADLLNRFRWLVFIAIISLTSSAAIAQETSSQTVTVRAGEQAPLLYVDCNRCDFAHLRREIDFVNHVRDPALAQIHVLITDQRTGAGGRRYELFFSGRGPFLGIDQLLRYEAASVLTSAEERDGLTEMIKIGLAPYLSQTSLAPRLRLSVHGDQPTVPIAQDDPWNSWTFELYGGGNFNVDATQHTLNARYGFYADRVTEDWKVRLRPYFNNNIRVFQTRAGDIRSVQYRHGFESHIIRSVGPHWGVGAFADYITTTFDNLRNRVAFSPAVEFSVFPYAEATRRQITFTYQVGSQYADYFEETIYEQTEELLFSHSLGAAVHFRQPWGSVWTSVQGSSFLHALEHYRITLNGNTSFRLMEGVSVNLGLNFQRINDQLSLPRGDASVEDILLQRRQLATAYRSWGQIGLSYQFGSIFNNVVNPRL